MSMINRPNRIEVVTSVQRRRRWTASEKVRMVEETFAPGMTVGLVARQHGVAPNQLFTWRRLVAQGSLTAAGSGEEVVPKGRTGGPNGRAEVRSGGLQHNSQLNGTSGRTLQNNATGMGVHGLQNNARGMVGGSMGAGGNMSPHGGAMGAHGGPGAGGAGAPAAHGGGPGNQH